VRSVLMLSYYYPPLGGIGSQRSQKFARYLPQYGWHPVVVTPANGSYFVDRSLDDGASNGVEVLRTGYVDISSLLKRSARSGTNGNSFHEKAGAKVLPVEGGPVVGFLRRAVRTWVYIPDGQIGWYPYAIRAGKRAIEAQKLDVIYSSSFPVTAHLAARKLKQTTGKPWIADFRDLWTENHYAEYSSTLRKRIDQMIESGLLEDADVLVTVSDAWSDTLRRLTNGRKRVEVIRNGFDASEFAEIEYNRPAKWTITYVGTFYGAKQDPSPCLEALSRLIESGKVRRDEVQFKMVGEPDAYVRDLAAGLHLDDLVSFTGFVSHGESLAHQVNSSLLLLIIHGDQANPGLVPGKLYEYLGSGRSILGIVPHDFEAARIIRDSRAGVAVEATNPTGIERHLLESYAAFNSGLKQNSNERDLSMYERKNGARQLAGLLTELAVKAEVRRT